MSVLFRVENAVHGFEKLSFPEVVADIASSGLNSHAAVGTETNVEAGQGTIPTAVLSWLENLLRERFHNDIVLHPSPTGYCTLWVPGSERRLTIRSYFHRFQNHPSTIPCGLWMPPDATWLPAAWKNLPAPGVEHLGPELVHESEHGCTLDYDVLGLAYWMLSRCEEVGASQLDGNGRFPAEASHAWRNGYLERPIVDEWFEVLRNVMRATWPELPLREHRYALRLSHDVDTPARYAFVGPVRLARSMITDLFRPRDRAALLRAPLICSGSKQRIDPRDPFNTFDWIMDRSEDAGLCSAFYFICGHTDPTRDGTYVPEHPAIIELMQRIHARGHEIGLHPSYHSYRNAEVIRNEAQRLRKACEQAGIEQEQFGVRMHYLRWETPTTLHGLEGAGLVYDTTLGYAKAPGFRCGTCHEYQAFDPVQNRALSLRIRPLIAMESTIIDRLRPDTVPEAQQRFLRLMQACQRVGGTFTVLWHNTMLEHAHQRQLYDGLLANHKESQL